MRPAEDNNITCTINPSISDTSDAATFTALRNVPGIQRYIGLDRNEYKC